jgi:hypothetical protein
LGDPEDLNVAPRGRAERAPDFTAGEDARETSRTSTFRARDCRKRPPRAQCMSERSEGHPFDPRIVASAPPRSFVTLITLNERAERTETSLIQSGTEPSGSIEPEDMRSTRSTQPGATDNAVSGQRSSRGFTVFGRRQPRV